MLLVLILLLASCATPAPKDEPVLLAPATFDAAVPDFKLPPTAEQKRRDEERRRKQQKERQQRERDYAEQAKRQRQREQQRQQREHQRCLAAHAAIDRCAEVHCKSYHLYMLWREVIATCPKDSKRIQEARGKSENDGEA